MHPLSMLSTNKRTCGWYVDTLTSSVASLNHQAEYPLPAYHEVQSRQTNCLESIPSLKDVVHIYSVCSAMDTYTVRFPRREIVCSFGVFDRIRNSASSPVLCICRCCDSVEEVLRWCCDDCYLRRRMASLELSPDLLIPLHLPHRPPLPCI